MPATTDLETRATELLHELAGPDASFREHQLEAIADLVEDRARVLCVQRTGWGKSAVYFIATALLRSDPARPAGPTLIVSPLLALMRNQIAAAQRLGIRAHTVNSTNRDAWDEISGLLAADAVDLLLISPERLNNPKFRTDDAAGVRRVRRAARRRRGALHLRLGPRLPARLPPHRRHARAAAGGRRRAVHDGDRQRPRRRRRRGAAADRRHSEASLVAYRGPLGRSSLRFEVVELPGQADRLAWLATYLDAMPGSGIVYTLTKRDAEQVAKWLNAHGVAAEAYTGEIETERRIAVEDRLLANDLKCVVATSALGMGYDKPDLGFVVHYQAPGSVIAYYQQVGRAGRAIERAEVVLLRGAEDRRIQDFFIEQAFPRRELVDRVLEHLGEVGAEGASTPELQAMVNLGRGRIDAMLKVLDVEGAVSRDGNRWVREPGSDWAYDAERYEHITALRRREQATMANFGADGRCLMRALQEELDDPGPQDCGRCSVCTGPRYDGPLDPGLVREAIDHLRSQPLALETKKMAPDAEGRMRKIPAEFVVEEGRALARLGDGGWAPGRAGGPRRRALRRRAARRRRPPRARLEPAGALHHRGALGAPPGRRRRPRRAPVGHARDPVRARCWQRTGERPRQREMSNAVLQAANVRGAFAVTGEPPPEGCLLLDDVRLSGWTLAMVGGQLLPARQRAGLPARARDGVLTWAAGSPGSLVALCAATAASAGAGAGAAAAEAATFTGQLQEIHGHRLDGSVVEQSWRVVDGSARRRLSDPQPAGLVGRTVTITDADPQTPVFEGRVRATADRRAPPRRRRARRASSSSIITTPDERTPVSDEANVRRAIFTEADSADAFFAQQSSGASSLTGLVNPDGDVAQVAISQLMAGCDYDAVAAAALAAAERQGWNTAAYDHRVYLHPNSDSCDYGGLGTLPGNDVWSNGYLQWSVIAHELGHNMGAHHASALDCRDGGRRVPLSGNCTNDEYGDPFDVMGRGGLMSAWHRSQIGQLRDRDGVAARVGEPHAVGRRRPGRAACRACSSRSRSRACR